jgi:hypothetical protein
MRSMSPAWRGRAHARLTVIRNDVRLLTDLAAAHTDLPLARAAFTAQVRRLAFEAAYLAALCRCPACLDHQGWRGQAITGRPSVV